MLVYSFLRNVAVSVERYYCNLIPNGCDEMPIASPFRYRVEAWLSIAYNNREEKWSVLSSYRGRSAMAVIWCAAPIPLSENSLR